MSWHFSKVGIFEKENPNNRNSLFRDLNLIINPNYEQNFNLSYLINIKNTIQRFIKLGRGLGFRGLVGFAFIF